MKGTKLLPGDIQSKAASNHLGRKGLSLQRKASGTELQRAPEEDLQNGGTAQTSNSFLVTTGVLSVSPDGGVTDVPSPEAGVDYDFCVRVVNLGELPSGPFFVRFELSGDQNPPLILDYENENGLAPGASEMAVVHFGSFPNQFGVYHLNACIHAAGSDSPIFCFPSGNDYTIFSR